MMTPAEVKGFQVILKKLSREDLLSLKDTVTNRQIAVEGIEEAIKVIIAYSETAQSLLRRKKITRDSLFQYLHSCDVIVSPNIDKNRMVDKILEYWKSNQGSSNTLQLTNSNINPIGNGLDPKPLQARLPSPDHLSLYTSEESCSSDASVLNLNVTNNAVSYQETNQNTWSVATPEVTSPSVPICQDQTLAETFVTWFYKMLNSQNPSMNQSPEDFGPQHFWNDAKLKLHTLSSEESTEEFEGCELVCQRFLAFMQEEFLLFNPNVGKDGVRCFKDPHGLVIICVCGTVHRNNDCLGTFQQRFGIIRDPLFDNNWKIKTTQLGIRCSNVTSIPKLENNNDMLQIAAI